MWSAVDCNVSIMLYFFSSLPKSGKRCHLVLHRQHQSVSETMKIYDSPISSSATFRAAWFCYFVWFFCGSAVLKVFATIYYRLKQTSFGDYLISVFWVFILTTWHLLQFWPVKCITAVKSRFVFTGDSLIVYISLYTSCIYALQSMFTELEKYLKVLTL